MKHIGSIYNNMRNLHARLSDLKPVMTTTRVQVDLLHPDEG